MPDLIDELINTGLLQFGLFGAHKKPFQLHLDLLPSYPKLLKQIVTQALPFTDGFDRLVCTPQSLPFGVAVALETNIPLVYSRGTDQDAVYDLAGAYDIGHPALLLIQDFSDDTEFIEAFIRKAHHVGLGISSILAIIANQSPPAHSTMAFHSLLDLTMIVNHLTEKGSLPGGHAQRMWDWINHHPG